MIPSSHIMVGTKWDDVWEALRSGSHIFLFVELLSHLSGAYFFLLIYKEVSRFFCDLECLKTYLFYPHV